MSVETLERTTHNEETARHVQSVIVQLRQWQADGRIDAQCEIAVLQAVITRLLGTSEEAPYGQ